MHENTPVRTVEPRTLRRLSPLAVVLAAGLVGGCANSPTRPVADNFNDKGRASMATASIEPTQAKGQFTPESFIVEGHGMKLEQQWVSEARIGAAELEARRAAAQAYQVKALANFDESAAAADAKLQTSFIERDSGYADAELTRKTHDARLYHMGRQIESRQVEKDIEFQRQESFLSASVKEWQAEVERIRSSAENEWKDSLAEHDRMMATRAAVQERGQAEIDRMVRAADLTADRAETKVRALRTEARSVADQTTAEVEKLNKLIETTRIQTEATVKELTERAHSLDDQLASRIAEMNAEATLLETTDADQEYQLRVSQAQVNYETTLGEAEDMRLSAEELSQQNASRVARMTAEANARFDSSRSSYEESIKGIHAHYSKLMADVARSVAEADRVEHTARSAFIKAEIDARTNALREAADHTRAIAKSEAEKIEAESVAEARRLQARFAKEFADQARKGSFALPSKLNERNPGVKNDDAAPEFAKASKKPENIHPEHIATFRTGLAKATELREQADASRLDAMAMRDSEMARFNDWWNNKQAEHRSTLASIDAFRQKADADVTRLISRADSMIARAETERGRALVEAEADRNEVFARIMALRGNSQTLDKKKDAQVRQLMAQADATARTGESKVASLVVQRDSTARRGEAKGRQLLAEASSLESSQRAVVAQMAEDINASRQILAAELNRLGQGAESFLTVAEANYHESRALADAFERIAVANTSELAARHVASRRQAEADIEYMAALTSANSLIRDADVTRIYARADEALGMGRARDIAIRGQIEADQQVALASVTREFSVADAQETGVRARFDQRVASTIASRNRSYADMYQASQFQRVRAEMASAEAASYAELSVAALQRLSATAESFRQNAQRNWDSRLAMPGTLPAPASSEELFEATTPSFSAPQFVVVPTGD
ncbi:MAG: hypothetical protein LAT64_08305 [Phycisphaerales bacterium]|nr:hypothetical protein [Planctomycetota bacterium]MCH8508757.1 hypothetical protein [Phycisphaerales bacterium]